MLRRDIIRRAFRGTWVGIDIQGQEKSHLRIPGFETYEGPDINEENNEELITDDEIKALVQAETKFQEAKKNLKEEKDEAKRRRGMIRINKP